MKLTKFFMPLAAVAMLASCSSDNLDGTPQEPAQNPSTSTDNGLRMNLTIAVPNLAGTRADGDINFDYGTSDEYAVGDATLNLFADNGGNPGNFVDDIEITAYFDGTGGNSAEITSVKTINGLQVEKISEKDATDNTYWAFVVLNKGGLTSLPTTDWDSFIKTTTNKYQDGNSLFTMTNALGWVGTEPGDDAPTWLAKVDKTNFYYEGSEDNSLAGTETAKQAPVAVDVYVQRVAAKVQLTGLENAFGDTPVAAATTGDSKDDKILFEEWYLDVTNTKSYPVQSLKGELTDDWYTTLLDNSKWSELTGAPLERFIKNTTSTTNAQKKYTRVMWGVDPNYQDAINGSGTNYQGADFTYVSDGSGNLKTTLPTGVTKHEDYGTDYCLENTFSVDAMMQNQSTRVLIKGTYFPKTVTNNTPTDFLSYNGICCVWNKTNLPFADGGENDADASGQYTLKDLFGDATAWDATQDKTKIDELKNICEALDIPTDFTGKINYHQDGEVWYDVIIRHFENEDLWDGEHEDDMNFAPTGNAYADMGDDSKDEVYLGRYGVLRNNWYVLNINSVLGPGSPTVPEPGNTPDDDPKKLLINCSINILSWAKREHGYDLK